MSMLPLTHKPHLVYYRQVWHLFCSRELSHLRGPDTFAPCLPGKTIPDVQARLRRDHDRHRFGYRS